jgi:phytoene dehydrogenase-like protein
MGSSTSSNGRDLIVVGGGLAGLAAATIAARNGLRVLLLEKAPDLGGRAQTQVREGYSFNVGAHALYRGGPGMRVLRELGVEPHGKPPSTSGGFAVHSGSAHTLPAGPVSLLTTSLFGLGAKLEVARLLAQLAKLDTAPLRGLSIDAGLARVATRPEVRELLRGLIRLATYTNDPERQSAGAALDQLKLALAQNVLYLDGGWRTLVEGLRAAAAAAGVEFLAGVAVQEVEADDSVRAVRLRDGGRLGARAVILAIAPGEASAIVGRGEHPALSRWARESIPVRAACLDVALRKLPQPRRTFALGIDRPLYLSVHSAAASLAPAGGALVHLIEYLPSEDRNDGAAIERELSALMTLIQPGWQEHVVHQRFLPHVVVSNRVVTAAGGGLDGRPGPEVPGVRQLFVAGDWVGREGQLADASLASAHRAATLATAAIAAHPARAA